MKIVVTNSQNKTVISVAAVTLENLETKLDSLFKGGKLESNEKVVSARSNTLIRDGAFRLADRTNNITYTFKLQEVSSMV